MVVQQPLTGLARNRPRFVVLDRSGYGAAETDSYLVVEAGHLTLTGGVEIEAGTTPLSAAHRGHEVQYQHTVAVRAHLVEKYQPSTVNRMLASLRGALEETWRLGLMDAETYRRAIDVPIVRGAVLPRGRALDSGELGELFQACTDDPSAMGRRDAAMLAVFYSTGMRRAELAGLGVADLDLEDGLDPHPPREAQ